MSSAFAQRSAGMVGVRGAPRPTLVNAGGDLSAVEHENDVATISAPTTVRELFNSGICKHSWVDVHSRLTVQVQGSGFRVQGSVQGSGFSVLVQSYRARCGREPRTLNLEPNAEP